LYNGEDRAPEPAFAWREGGRWLLLTGKERWKVGAARREERGTVRKNKQETLFFQKSERCLNFHMIYYPQILKFWDSSACCACLACL